MSTAMLEQRLSVVEAELAGIKRLLKADEQSLEMLSQKKGELPKAGTTSITDMLIALANEIPEEERVKMPADLAEQHDHYIYGWPKK